MESSLSGSDHYNFHLKGIPTAFLFSGRHEDLHAPTDDAEKVDYEKVQRLSQLIYEVTAEHDVPFFLSESMNVDGPVLQLYGNYDRSPFDAVRSPVMIWVLQKA